MLGTANLGNEIVPRKDNSLVVLGNDGTVIRKLPVPMATTMCGPIKWWTPGSVLIHCSSEHGSSSQLWELPLDGGTPERLTAAWEELGIHEEGVFYHPTLSVFGVSPDGSSLLGYYTDPQRRGWRIGLFPIAGGTPKRFEIARIATQWTADGRGLLYLDSLAGIANIFLQPLDGGAAKPVTRFTGGDGVLSFALSRDGKQLAFQRGDSTLDVVLIRNVEK